MNDTPARKVDEILSELAALYPSPIFQHAGQQSFFVAGGPTAEQLANLSGQCSETEWLSLCRNAEFLDAACRDLASTAAVASKLLGREISAHIQKPTKEKP